MSLGNIQDMGSNLSAANCKKCNKRGTDDLDHCDTCDIAHLSNSYVHCAYEFGQ